MNKLFNDSKVVMPNAEPSVPSVSVLNARDSLKFIYCHIQTWVGLERYVIIQCLGQGQRYLMPDQTDRTP